MSDRTALVEALRVCRRWIVEGQAQIGWSVSRIDEVLTTVTPTPPSEREGVPSVPNPCSVCGVPIFGSFVGTGDGTMRAGGSFAHPDCYWRQRAEAAEAEREAVRVLEERSRQVHRLERNRTGHLEGAHGTWMGVVYRDWEECPSEPCASDRALLAALRAEGEGGKQ